MNEELIQYLSDEYMKCVHEEEELIQRKYELEAKKRKCEESASFHLEDEKRRQLFSPLYLKDFHYQQDASHDEFEMSEAGQNLQKCEADLRKIEKSKKKLKGFIHSLGQISLKFDELEEKETVTFFPAFDEVLDVTKKVMKDVEIDYDIEKESSNCCMTFRFLSGWKNMFDYFAETLLLSYIMINTMVDRNRIIIVVECISQVPLGNHVKNGLEKVLSEDFYIQSWNENTFEVNIIIK